MKEKVGQYKTKQNKTNILTQTISTTMCRVQWSWRRRRGSKKKKTKSFKLNKLSTSNSFCFLGLTNIKTSLTNNNKTNSLFVFFLWIFIVFFVLFGDLTWVLE
jgi:L-asparagine transporter-like permease